MGCEVHRPDWFKVPRPYGLCERVLHLRHLHLCAASDAACEAACEALRGSPEVGKEGEVLEEVLGDVLGEVLEEVPANLRRVQGRNATPIRSVRLVGLLVLRERPDLRY